MRWLVAAATLFGCYREPFSNADCTITCSGAVDSCPGDLVCEGGYCVSDGQVCKPAFVHVAAGTGFACGIDESAALWCWGSNIHHQVSTSEELSFPLATRVDTVRHWQQLEAGGEHVCGIADGKLLCWGANGRGQVSDTVSGDVSSPLEISVVGGPASWSTVAAGVRSTCAIGEGRLYCWGANGSGQLGDGTQTDRGAPTLVAGATDWTTVAVGDRHVCAMSAAGGVYCWGTNSDGQVGSGASNPQLTPHSVPIMASMLAVSQSASCATTPASELYCWGSNYYGELGEANQMSSSVSTPLLATATGGWSSVVASEDSLCGVRDGQVVCWGATVFGALGDGYWYRRGSDHVFANVAGTQGATQVSIGWNERLDPVNGSSDAMDLTLACAVVGTDILCWGDNRYGQLGMGGATMAITPTTIAGNPNFSDLDAGQSHACGIQNGVVSCWGSTEYGAATGVYAGGSAKACNPNLDCDVATPKPLNFFSPNATDVALGALHTCAFHAGTITCWGDNGSNQLLSGTPAAPRERDIPGPGGAPWTGIMATGRLGQCGIYRSGSIDATACWGNVLTNRTTVQPVAMLNGALSLAFGATPSGYTYDCILDAMGVLQCQGDNQFGEYGDGTMNQFGSLAPVNPQRTYAALATPAVGGTLCAIRTDQGIECWGNNARGQTGTLADSITSTPNVITGLAQCTAIAVGYFHACAICSGSISCWGDNTFGQLGSGKLDKDPQPLPTTIAGPPPQGAWVQLVAGSHFTCARSDAGLSQCWGFERHAALGNGARSANLPVLVGARPAQ